jgi:regulator of sigma E protease
MILTAITFVAVIGLLIFVHEFGHFFAAKRHGVRVDEFGFGFPPRIAGIKRGDTLYSLNWIPLGGFVRIKGESGDAAHDADSFSGKGVGVRAIILTAGVVMNLVLAWVLLSFGYMIGLPQVAEDLSGLAHVRDQRLQVMQILPMSPAETAGLEQGDAVMAVDGTAVDSVEVFRDYTGTHAGVPIALTVERKKELKTFEVTPTQLEGLLQPGIGIALVTTGIVSYPVWYAPIQGLYATYGITTQILSAFGSVIYDLFATRQVNVEFSGPIGIAVITGQVAALGFRHLLQFTALLSINLAVINILPIPALDGGRLAFLIAEWARRGKAVSRRIEMTAHNIGFSLLILLIVVITYRDLVRHGDAIWKAMMSVVGA